METQLLGLIFQTLIKNWTLLMSTYLFAFPVLIGVIGLILALVLKGRNK